MPKVIPMKPNCAVAEASWLNLGLRPQPTRLSTLPVGDSEDGGELRLGASFGLVAPASEPGEDKRGHRDDQHADSVREMGPFQLRIIARNEGRQVICGGHPIKRGQGEEKIPTRIAPEITAAFISLALEQALSPGLP